MVAVAVVSGAFAVVLVLGASCGDNGGVSIEMIAMVVVVVVLHGLLKQSVRGWQDGWGRKRGIGELQEINRGRCRTYGERLL